MNFLFLSMCAFSISSICFADDDFSKEIFKSTALTTSIYMLEGAGGNITASIGPDGVFLVDDDFAEMNEKLVIKLKDLGGSSPRFIVNTHFHYDHTGGNEKFGKTATVIAATAVRNRLMTEQILWGKRHPAAPSEAWPILTFDESLTLRLNNEDIRIVHLPHGHTDGDSIVFFDKNKVVSMGDLYFSGMYPIFHVEHDGSLDGFIQDIKMVLRQIPYDAKIIPGHGPLSRKAELQKYCDMIEVSVEFMKRELKKGHSLEQIQKTKVPPNLQSFSHGYLNTNQWLALVYKGIKK
ncbi:MAG: MBL fold metallo-hydrolase [Bdellovibrionaceae bacterium]|nr:MBL fold metallo-hydrolase [Pseudobdellovibrionaceae bacterium]